MIKKFKKSITITVALIVYNEANNIAGLLNDILRQKYKFNIKQKVLILNDGSTDNTKMICSQPEFYKSGIKVINYRKNKGKITRLNFLLRTCHSRILVNLDGDIRLSGNYVVNDLVNPIILGHADFTGGNDLPYTGLNNFQKSLALRVRIWKNITENINNGNNIHNHPGRITAMGKNVYQSINIPVQSLAEDDYRYTFNLNQGHRYVYVKNAIIYYKLPLNPTDYLVQFSRFKKSEAYIRNQFGISAVKNYRISKISLIQQLLKSIFSHPYQTILVAYYYLILLIRQKNISYPVHNWIRVASTK